MSRDDFEAPFRMPNSFYDPPDEPEGEPCGDCVESGREACRCALEATPKGLIDPDCKVCMGEGWVPCKFCGGRGYFTEEELDQRELDRKNEHWGEGG